MNKREQSIINGVLCLPIVCLLGLAACTREFGLTLIAADSSGGVGRAVGRESSGVEVGLGGRTYLGQYDPASGRASMLAADGRALRCRWPSAGPIATGTGSCQDGAGKTYSMQVWR